MLPLFVLLLLLSMPFFGLGSDEPLYCRTARQITGEHIVAMKSQGFVVNMTGGGFMKSVEEISLGFEKRISPTLAEARELYVRAVRDLLGRVNSNAEVRPYLRNLPFTIENLTYRMNFNDVPVVRPGKEPISYVSCARKTIIFCVFDPNSGESNPLRVVHRESFDEAQHLVDTDAEKSPH